MVVVNQSKERGQKMFKETNPHPQGKRVGDCVKRAIVIASEINYHDVAIMLNRFKNERGLSKFNNNDNWKPFIEQVLLGRKNKGDMQHEFYGHRYTVDDWAKYWDSETSILRCSKHLVATKNGDYYDTWDSGEKGVYIAYFIPGYETIVEHIKKNYPKLCKGLTLERYIPKVEYFEIENPKPNIEYWIVIDEENCAEHFFTCERHARKYAKDFNYSIVFQECFN